MNSLHTLFPENLYHSYIVESNPETTVQVLLDYLIERGEIDKASPDVLCQSYDAFSMDDCALIKEWHNKMGVTGGKRICILGTKFINREAERALLKMIEEPAINTHFFIIVPNASVLLDTILSRAHVVKISNSESDNMNKEAKKFVSQTPADRIEYIAEIIKKNKDNDNSGGLRSDAIELINGIEQIMHKRMVDDKNNKDIEFILTELQNCRQFLGTGGASVKMILEHIALVI